MIRYRRSKKIFIGITFTIVFVFLGNILISFAATSSELKQQQQQNQAQINEAKNEQDQIRSQMTAIQKEVEDLNSKIANYQNEILDLADQINETSVNIENMQLEIERTQKELEEKQRILEKRLVASYKAGETKYLEVLLGSQSLTDFLSAYYYMEQLADCDTRLIEAIKETKKQIEESKQALEASKLALEEVKKNQEIKKEALAVVKNEKEQKKVALSEEERELQKKIEEMQAEDSKIREAIKQAEREEELRRKQQQSSGQSISSNPGGYIYPVPSAYAKITTGLYYSNGSYHGAVDFGSAGISGQPVYAVKSGTVVLTQSLTYSYGNYILINHHDGTYTLYAHGQAGSICVSTGQSVSQGQQIMRVGSTGNSTGPHLHFEVRVSPGGYNNRVSPLKYL